VTHGLSFHANAFASCMDALRLREELDRKLAETRNSIRLDVLYGTGCVRQPLGCHILVDDERVPVDPVAPVEFPCLSCGASRTEYQRGRRCCAYCGSDR